MLEMTVFERGVADLRYVLEVILQSHPAGLRVLLGTYPVPTTRDWEDLLTSPPPDLGTRVDVTKMDYSPLGFIRVDEIERTIERAGGWEYIVKVVQSFRECEPLKWNLFVEKYNVDRRPDTRLGEESRLQDICERYRVHHDTIYRYRALVPEMIANQVLGGCQAALFPVG